MIRRQKCGNKLEGELPFKTRDDLDCNSLMAIASKYFGSPCNVGHGANRLQLSWDFQEQYAEVRLTIDYSIESNLIQWNYDVNLYPLPNYDTKISVENYPSFKPKVSSFIKEIKKPWCDWTEAEILEDPMWVYYFYLSNGCVSEAMHTYMVLGDGHNNYIRKYFSLWQERNQPAS